jgi:hypothetical protein
MSSITRGAAGWICVAALMAGMAGITACQKKPDPQAAAAHHQNAIEVAVWGTPIVSFDAMRQAFFRDGHAQYNDILYYSKPADWKLQLTTPNASAHYVFFHFNLKNGPVVLDIPAAVGAGLFGSILDAWQVPMADVGPAGADQGKGGKYVLLPPGYQGEMAEGYFPVRFRTVNGYCGFRAIPEGTTEAAVGKALGLVRKMKVYPLAQVSSPPEQRFIDMSGKLFDGIVRFDETFYASLARMVDEEPVLPRDQAMMDQLGSLGIVKGTTFQQGAAARDSLRTAAAAVHQFFVNQTTGEGAPFWAGRNWRTASTAGAATAFTFETNGVLNREARGLFYFLACAPPAKLGKATMYLTAFVDSSGQPLSGESSYTLHVPARVPAKQFWAATVYDAETAAFIRESPKVEINSYQALQKNTDGSVDLYFGPSPPSGKESNWASTSPGKKWFTIFRFYGPEAPIMNRSWRLPDFVRTAPPAS